MIFPVFRRQINDRVSPGEKTKGRPARTADLPLNLCTKRDRPRTYAPGFVSEALTNVTTRCGNGILRPAPSIAGFSWDLIFQKTFQ